MIKNNLKNSTGYWKKLQVYKQKIIILILIIKNGCNLKEILENNIIIKKVLRKIASKNYKGKMTRKILRRSCKFKNDRI